MLLAIAKRSAKSVRLVARAAARTLYQTPKIVAGVEDPAPVELYVEMVCAVVQMIRRFVIMPVKNATPRLLAQLALHPINVGTGIAI